MHVICSIFIILFAGRCPSYADPALCATIFNYSVAVPFEFYNNYPDNNSLLNNAEFKTCMQSALNNEEFDLKNHADDSDHTVPKWICMFCDTCNINYDVATMHLKGGAFDAFSKESLHNKSVHAGKHIVNNILPKLLDNLTIKTHEFCQMMNYEQDACKYYWSQCVNANNLDSFVQCLNEESEENHNDISTSLITSHGPMATIDVSDIFYDLSGDNRLENYEIANQLFKCCFTLYLHRANGEEIFNLHKRITGEKFALGCKGISIRHINELGNDGNKLMTAHTCAKSLELHINEGHIDAILSSFDAFRAAINSQFTGMVFNFS